MLQLGPLLVEKAVPLLQLLLVLSHLLQLVQAAVVRCFVGPALQPLWLLLQLQQQPLL
jgi:hypothetical protein